MFNIEISSECGMFLPCRIGFVTQDDLLFPQLTVKETLMFAAQLRLPRTMTFEEKIMRAETVLKDLGLERSTERVLPRLFVVLSFHKVQRK